MLKKIVIPLFVLATCLATSVATAQVGQAQAGQALPPYDIKAGGGLVYGTEVENLGLQINGYYRLPVNEQIFVGGDLTYFFADSETFAGTEFSSRLITININGQYHFLQEDALGAYGLGGINYAMMRVSVESPDFDMSETESEVGLNLGAGVEYQMNFGLIYGELKFVISDFDQLVIGAGIRIPIGG